jgi:hypothetical protein
MIQRKTHSQRAIDKMYDDMEASMRDLNLEKDASFASSERPARPSAFFDLPPTQNEAWVTRCNRTFETYARRVMQYIIIGLNGPTFDSMLNTLRMATIATTIQWYKSLLSNFGMDPFVSPATSAGGGLSARKVT